MDNKKDFLTHTIDLTNHECKHISGGDEWSEGVTRLFGFVYQSLRNINWAESSWANNPRAQR